MNSVLEILSFTGFIQGCLVGFLAIFHEKFNKGAFTLLGALVLLMSIDSISQSELIVSNYPIVYWINNGNLFLFGPLFYFFVKAVKTDTSPYRLEFLLHLAPFILIKTGTLVLGPTNIGEDLLPASFFLALNQLVTVHGTIYAIIALFEAVKVRRQSDNNLKTFTFWLSVVYAFGWITSFMGRQLEWYNLPVANTMWTITYLALLTMILVITVQLMLYREHEFGSKAIIQISGNITETTKNKYNRSILKLNDCRRLSSLLNKALQEEKLYLDPELNRSKLAAYINVSPHTLSQLLNNHLHKSFSEYINEFRLIEAKRKLVDPAYKDFTILAIAFESGFKSKSSFQRLFKKYTGKTPSKYLEETKGGHLL